MPIVNGQSEDAPAALVGAGRCLLPCQASWSARNSLALYLFRAFQPCSAQFPNEEVSAPSGFCLQLGAWGSAEKIRFALWGVLSKQCLVVHYVHLPAPSYVCVCHVCPQPAPAFCLFVPRVSGEVRWCFSGTPKLGGRSRGTGTSIDVAGPPPLGFL